MAAAASRNQSPPIVRTESQSSSKVDQKIAIEYLIFYSLLGF